MATRAQRARIRATRDRIRAYVRTPGRFYHVWNLTKHRKYIVWWNTWANMWECTCRANNLKQRCKHVQRVLDREEKRIRREELENEPIN